MLLWASCPTHSKMLSLKLLTVLACLTFELKSFLDLICKFLIFLSPEVIEKYKSKIQGLEKDLKEILKQESEEKEVGM